VLGSSVDRVSWVSARGIGLPLYPARLERTVHVGAGAGLALNWRRQLRRQAVLPAPASAVPEQTYWSSRWSTGNLFFPDSLTLANDSILFRKGGLFSSSTEQINYRAVASVRARNGLFFCTLSIETSGGSQPIVINGLSKQAAEEIQQVVRSRQAA
jgi:hypothetical protein